MENHIPQTSWLADGTRNIGRNPATTQKAELRLSSALVLLLLASWASPDALGKSNGWGEASSAVNSKGYDSNTAFVTIDGPMINAFNLNFMVQFPLAVGLNLPENAGITLRPDLNYNSRVTNFQSRGINATAHRYVRVRRQNPFGLGFDVSLGRIVRYPTLDGVVEPPAGRLVYIDSSGASHGLAPTAAGNEWRTHDGSHIRAVWADDKWTVSFPDGLVQELDHFIGDHLHTDTNPLKNDLRWGTTLDGCDVVDGPPCEPDYFIPDPVGDQNGLDWLGFDRDFVGWHVTKVYTRAATSPDPASYTVEYFGADGNNLRFAHIIRFIRDQHNRTIEFQLDATNGTVSGVLTPAAPSDTGPRPATQYLFEYKTVTLNILGLQHKVRALWRMWSPNVADSGTQKYLHTFDYTPSGGGNFGGQLSRLDYPSGKSTLISYSRYDYLNGSQGYCMGTGSGTGSPDECHGMTNGGTCAWSWGVDQIDTFLNGNSSDGSLENRRTTTFAQHQEQWDYWFYGSENSECTGSPHPSDRPGYYRYDQVHTMIDPAGNKTEFVYRTPRYEDQYSDPGEPQQYYGLLVAERYYGGNGGPNTRLMKTVETWPYVKRDSVHWTYKDADYEMVPQSIVTTWHDDEAESGLPLSAAPFLREDRSDFDDCGHYQRAEFSGTAIGSEGKVVIKDYAADNETPGGALCPTAAQLQSNWLCNVVASEETKKKIGSTETTLSRVDHGYDTSRGLRTRTIARSNLGASVDACANDPLAATGDVATDFAFTARGDLASERHYLPGAGADSAPTDVTTAYTYQYGARESAKNTGLNYYEYVRIIDPASGLVKEERSYPMSLVDTAATTTKFGYDPIGRTTKITRGTDAPVTIAYENETASGFPSPASRLRRIRSAQGVGLASIETVDHFVWGRLDKEEKVNPDGSQAYRYTRYNNADRVSFVSEWTRQTTSSGVPGTTTLYGVSVGSSHAFEEPFGRPTKVIDPLGGGTLYRYFGTNKEITTFVALKSTASLEQPAFVVTRYFTDALGRLRFVSEPKVINIWPDGQYEETGAAAAYTYDVLGRMRQVDLSATGTISPAPGNRFNTDSPSPQSRTFEYDALGRLTSETSPEAGTTYYERWNAFGAVTQTRDAEAADRDYVLRTAYDVAGRATRLSKVSTSTTTSETFNAGAGGLFNKGGWRFNSTGNCLLGTPSWYIGDTNCQYTDIDDAELESGLLDLGRASVLSFKYFREVHGDSPGSSGRDTLRVQIRDTGASPSVWQDVYVLDSTQVSWSKWMRSPAIDLSPWLPTIGSARIQFVFDSGGPNAESSLRGVGIAEVTVGQPSETVIQETAYDETFGIHRNMALGKPTRVIEYDEATGTPVFTREIHYAQLNGRVSDERITIDWDRDGTPTTLATNYNYDNRGDLVWRKLPHVVGTAPAEYSYTLNHGAVVGITVSDTSGVKHVLGGEVGTGIEYDDSGSMKLVRFANQARQNVSRNAASLTSRIWVDHASSPTPLFDTGMYSYDGARNIKQIGGDYYRYDAAARLTWSRTVSGLYGTVDLDQQYDAFGNMTAQTASFPGGGSPTLPNGLVFSGRGYSSGGSTTNRIESPAGTFVYDAAGRLRREAAHHGLPPQAYSHSANGDLAHVSDGAGRWYQSALYEGDGHRWFRSQWAEGGKALLTVRDASGQVVADFSESSSSSGLKLEKEYVYANDQLVAINSTCGPRPSLALSNPSVANGQVWFDRTDYVAAAGSYSLVIKTEWGSMKTLSLPASLPNHFGIPLSEFFEGPSNEIRIEADAACGHTGYSNAVVFGYASAPSAPGCLTSVGVSRSGFSGTGSNLMVSADGACPAGTTYNLHFQAFDDELGGITLNGGAPQIQPLMTLSNMPCDSGEGYYWASPVIPGSGGAEGPASVVIYAGSSTCGSGGGGGQPGQPARNLQFVHWDHLGSTRLVTDEQGAAIASMKFFPFGYEAENLGGDELRQKFTGHERDDRVGLDYMMARSCRMSLARFLEPDPYDGSARAALPQSWNRYAYVLNDPINFKDPSGYLERKVGSGGDAGGSHGEANDGDQPGEAQPDNSTATVGSALAATGQYIGGVVRGIAASLTFGLAPGSAPQPSDTPSSLAGQAGGSLLVAYTGINTAIGGAAGAIVTSPAAVTVAGAVIPAGSAAVAAVGVVATAGAAINLGHVAAMAKTTSGSGQRKGERGASGRPSGTNNPAKHARFNRETGRYQVKDPHTGKWKDKPPGWKPD